MNRTSQFIMFTAIAVTFAACGPRKSENSSDLKIVGGKAVGQYEHSALSTVALMTASGQSFCTGSLINPTTVVTAGHCVQDWKGPMVISFGIRAHVDTRMIAATKRLVKRIVQHPQYRDDHDDKNPNVGMNDIAVLQLNAPAPKPFRPMPMAPATHPIRKGERLILAGFGVTQVNGENPGDRLRKVDTILSGVRNKAREFDFGPTFGKTSCNGDSGGPAFVVRRGKPGQSSLVLVGVTSRGNFCQDSGTYTDIRLFIPWLSKVVVAWQKMDAAAAAGR